MTTLKEDVAFIGIGGCGTNIAFLFEKLGYKAVHINSSTQDESAISNAKIIKHLNGYNGCAGDRNRAMEAIASNQDLIDYLSAMDENILFISFGAGGGTGSGIGPTLAGILSEETDKTICCIVALPDKSEDMGYQVNAYQCAKELNGIETIGSTIFIDNNRLVKRSMINNRIVSMIDAFLSNESVSKYGNVDEQEKRTILSQNGNLIFAKGKLDTSKAIEQITTDNIFAPIQNDGICEYMAIINSSGSKVDKAELIRIIGTPKRTFEGYGSNETIVAASGLTYPLDYILSLGSLAKQRNLERKQHSKSIELADLDIEADDKPKSKKKSSRELLMRFAK